jgi:septum formation protein
MLLHESLNRFKIYLASQSPRRKALLEGLDINFEVLVRPGIDETTPPGLTKTEIPVYLAGHKSNSYQDLLLDKTIVITADTIVWHKERELGKPRDFNDAVEILKELSGNMHEVITGVCIRSHSQMRTFHTLSKVWFREISEPEIEYYLKKYKPYDKAGAYGIQEWIGYSGIQKIEGSFYNVMGLPVQTVYTELIDFINHETK